MINPCSTSPCRTILLSLLGHVQRVLLPHEKIKMLFASVSIFTLSFPEELQFEVFWLTNSTSVQNVMYIYMYIYIHTHTYIFDFSLLIVNEAFCGCSILIEDNMLWPVLTARSIIIFKLELKKNHLQIIHCLLKTPLFRHVGSISISSTYSPSHMQKVKVSNHDDSTK